MKDKEFYALLKSKCLLFKFDLKKEKMKKESIVEFYDNLAEKYEELYGEEQEEKWQEITKIIENLNSKESICLELGCGVGIKNLKKYFAKVFGFDISFKSLEIAKNKSFYDFLINADLDKLKFCEERKDLFIISASVLQNLEEKTIDYILRLNVNQIHSVMYRSKGEEYWIKKFEENNFKFVKKIRNDLIFVKIIF